MSRFRQEAGAVGTTACTSFPCAARETCLADTTDKDEDTGRKTGASVIQRSRRQRKKGKERGTGRENVVGDRDATDGHVRDTKTDSHFGGGVGGVESEATPANVSARAGG